MRAAKWHNEIEIFRQIKPCIILEGNILDQFQYPTEPFRNRHLPEYLYKLLKDLGYNVVVIYDESKGFYAVSGGQKDLVAFADLLQDVPGLRLTNDMIRCPFSAQGSCYTPSNPESADSARNKNDGQLLDSVCPAAATIGEAVTNALRQSDVSVAIIIGEDNIVVYDFIRPDVAESILKLHINRVKVDFRDNSEIEIDTSAIEKVLLEKCCSSEVLEYGGRGIRNTVESCLYTPLTRFIYDHQDTVTAGKAIVIRSLDLNSSPVGIDAEVEE